MLPRNWIELILVAAALITCIVLHIRYRRKVGELNGFIGIVEEHGESERLDNYDWQAEMFRELERAKSQKRRFSKKDSGKH